MAKIWLQRNSRRMIYQAPAQLNVENPDSPAGHSVIAEIHQRNLSAEEFEKLLIYVDLLAQYFNREVGEKGGKNE